jgi:hypothetical protein
VKIEAPTHRPINTLRASLPGSDGLPRETLRRALKTGALALFAAVVLVAAAGPGRTIRGELLAAADELSAQIVANPTEPVRQAMRRHFREAEVEVDTAWSWPNVLVTLRGLDRAACEAVLRDARRLEGVVVVSLDAYRSPADCGERNDMTWRIMP